MRLQPLRQVLEECIHPRGRHLVDGHAVHPGGAPVRTHDRPCPPQDVHAVDVAIQGVEASFGFLLGTAVERPLQGSDLVQRTATRSGGAVLPAGGPSRYGTHPDPSLFADRIDEAGALRSRWVVLSRRSALLRPLRLPLGSPPLPGSAGYRRTTLPGTHTRGRGGALQFPGQPSDHSTPLTPGGSSATAPGPRSPSMAFALQAQARHLLGPPLMGQGLNHDAAGFTSCCGLAGRTPPEGRLSLRFDARLSTNAGSQLPRTLASPRSGLPPAGCPELDARLHPPHLL
jgi:hypothetical protein